MRLEDCTPFHRCETSPLIPSSWPAKTIDGLQPVPKNSQPEDVYLDRTRYPPGTRRQSGREMM
jgi:hypothetical protein